MAQAKTEQRQLLKPFSKTPLGAIEKFIVVDELKIGKKIGDYTVGYIGPNFKTHFMGAVEESIPARELSGHTLTEYSRNPPIVTALGGTIENLGPAATAIAHLVEVAKLGKRGPGLFNGYANIGYAVSPVDKKPWAVHWFVYGGELDFDARPVSDPYGWFDGFRVFGG